MGTKNNPQRQTYIYYDTSCFNDKKPLLPLILAQVVAKNWVPSNLEKETQGVLLVVLYLFNEETDMILHMMTAMTSALFGKGTFSPNHLLKKKDRRDVKMQRNYGKWQLVSNIIIEFLL